MAPDLRVWGAGDLLHHSKRPLEEGPSVLDTGDRLAAFVAQNHRANPEELFRADADKAKHDIPSAKKRPYEDRESVHYPSEQAGSSGCCLWIVDYAIIDGQSV